MEINKRKAKVIMVKEMKKVFVLIILLMIMPLAEACFSPVDILAVEVYFNKPEITYNLELLKNAENVEIIDGKIVYRSHYDERVAVMLWEDESLHLRIEIPPKGWSSTVFSARFTTSMIIPESNIEKAKELGWKVEGKYAFRKGNILIQITPQKGSECSKDSDCATGGCSGEICTTKEEAKKVASICIYEEWYDCLKLTSCGCVNGICIWKPNDAFERCLKKHGIDPSEVIKMPQAEVYITIYGKELTEDKKAEIKELFSILGMSCALENIEFDKKVIDMPEGIVDHYTFNFKEALRVELEWLKENGIINIDDRDIQGIVKVAERGKAGYNSHIGWYDDKDGSFAWIPYDESKNPKLLKCIREPMRYNLPNGTLILSTTTTKTPPQTTVCGPTFILLLALVPLLKKRL